MQAEGGGGGIVKWLLDEISQREKEAERSLMHRSVPKQRLIALNIYKYLHFVAVMIAQTKSL